MKTVLVLTGLGMLSLVVLSTLDRSPSPPAQPPEIRVSPPVETEITVVQVQEARQWEKAAADPEMTIVPEDRRRKYVRERILPAEAWSAPVLERRYFSRAGPERQFKVKKQARID
jgi:hypothetical protein